MVYASLGGYVGEASLVYMPPVCVTGVYVQRVYRPMCTYEG